MPAQHEASAQAEGRAASGRFGATRSRSPRRRHVDPVRVHLITLVVFGVIAGAVLAVWTFPKFFLGLLLLGASAIVYAKLYGFIEQRLEAEEGRLAKELGFALEDDEASEDQTELDLDLEEELANVRSRRRRAGARRRKTSKPARTAAEADGGENDDPEADEPVPTPSRVVETGASAPEGGGASPASSSSTS